MGDRPHLRRFVALGAAAAILVSACSTTTGSTTKIGSPPYERGSGQLASESRPLPVFQGVSAAQGILVELGVGSSPATVTADDNLLSHITTDVRDGTLHVGVRGSIETAQQLRVVVATTAPVQRLSASSGATIRAPSLQGGSLAVDASSGATIDAGGTVSDLRVSSMVGSTADLRDLQAVSAHVEVGSGATARVTASDRVDGSCTLGSTLRVGGGATTSGVMVDGSSTLARD